MRAVNLIPAEERRGAGGSAGRSGGAVYVLLGLLTSLVLIASLWALAGKQVDDRKTELKNVTAEAQSTAAQAAGLQKYTTFAQLAASRRAAITTLAAGRQDWSQTMRELARVLPRDARLADMNATTGATTTAGAAAAGAPTAAVAPTAKLTGCTSSQRSVAVLLTRLRAMDGVESVSLESSEKQATTGGTAGAVAGAAGTGAVECPGKNPPKFAVTVTYRAPAAAAAPATTAPATGAQQP